MCKSIFSFSKIYPACTVYVAFAHHVPRFSQMNGAARQFILWIKLVAVLCKSWWRVVKFAWLSSFNFFLKGGLGHVAFHSIILFENSAIPWLVARLAYVNNVDKVMRNYICARKWNFHMHISFDTEACDAVNICKFANLHVVTIISRKTLFVTKSNFVMSIWVIKFTISQFQYNTIQ